MAEAPNETPARNCGRPGDLRTFVIALLTSLIVVMLYHCGGALCRMFCPPCAPNPPVRYMLVPVMDCPRAFHPMKMKKHLPPACARPAALPGCPAPAAEAPAPAPATQE